MLALPGFDRRTLRALDPALDDMPDWVVRQLGKEMTYHAYLQRQDDQIAALRADEACAIPDDIDYHGINGLSRELAGKLSAARPETLAQASRIDGMTPAALVLVLARLQARDRRASA